MSESVIAPGRTTLVGYRSLTKIRLDFVAVLIFSAIVAAYFWFITNFGANTIWIDQWSDLNLIQHAFSGHLTFSALWAPHHGNRILFPNLVVLLLAEVTHFNVKSEEFLSGLTLAGATAVLIVGHRRRTLAPWILYVPLAIVMLSFDGYGNTLWGFQFAWYLLLLALSAALVLCDHPTWGWPVFIGAIAAGVVGSYSSLQGLLIWPAGLVILLLRRRPFPFWMAWIGSAALTSVLYFLNWNDDGTAGDNYILHHPIHGLRFFFFSVGNVFGSSGGNGAVVLGVLIVGAALWLTVSSVLKSRDEAAPLGVGLICFGLLFALTITIGRGGAGLNAGGGRYLTFDLLTLVGCYLLIVGRVRVTSATGRSEEVLWWASTIIVGISVVLVLIPGVTNGLDGARSLRASQNQASRVIANMRAAPDEMVERVLIGIGNWFLVPQTRDLASFARQNHLTLFASSSTVNDLVNSGLPYSHSSLTTTLFPIKDDAMGVVHLLAFAQSDYGVEKLQFEIKEPSGRRERLNAIDSVYGWIGTWNTIPLPDGRYRVQSLATDHASDRATSPSLSVNVENNPGG